MADTSRWVAGSMMALESPAMASLTWNS